MGVVPAHRHLKRGLEIGQALVARHEHAPPDRRADLQEKDVKLVDFSWCLFFRHCLFSFRLLARKHLDALFQLLATGQGVAYGRSNSRRAIFRLMTCIDRDLFQRPASLAGAISLLNSFQIPLQKNERGYVYCLEDFQTKHCFL